MKKLFLLPALLLVALIFVSPAFATSGCCSGHGGVNCAAGAQSNGHVICNDGWTGSSCSYASMVMCGGSSGGSTTAPTSTPVQNKIEEPTSTPTLKLTGTSTPTPTFTPTPTIEATPSTTPTSTITPSPTATLTPSVRGTKTELLYWKFHWWNVSPLMGLLGSIFRW